MSHQLYFVNSPTESAFKLGSKTPCCVLRRYGYAATVRTLDQLVFSVNVADLAPRYAADRQIFDYYSMPYYMKLFVRIPSQFRPYNRRFSPLNRLHFDPSFSSNYMLMRARNVQSLCARQAVCYNLLHFIFDNVLVKISQGGVFRCRCFVTGRVVVREDKNSMLLKLCTYYSQIFNLDAQPFFAQLSSDLRVVCAIKDKYEQLQVANQLARKICQFSAADQEYEQTIVIVSDGGDFSGFQLQAYDNALKSCYIYTKSIRAVQFNASERRIEKVLRAILKEFFDQPYYDVICNFSDLNSDQLKGIMVYQRNYEMLTIGELYMGYYQKSVVIDYINRSLDGFWMDDEVFAVKKGQQLVDDETVPLSVQLMRQKGVEHMPDLKTSKESYNLAKSLQERTFTPQSAEMKQNTVVKDQKRRATSSLRKSQSNVFQSIDRVEINAQAINVYGSRLSNTPSPDRRRARSANREVATLDLGFLKKKSFPYIEQQERQFFDHFETLDVQTDEFYQKTAAACNLQSAVSTNAPARQGDSSEGYYGRRQPTVLEVLPSPFEAVLSKAEMKRKLIPAQTAAELPGDAVDDALVVYLQHYSPKVVVVEPLGSNIEYDALRYRSNYLEVSELQLQISLSKPRELPRTEKIMIGAAAFYAHTEPREQENSALADDRAFKNGHNRTGSISPLEQLAMESQTCCTEEVVAENAPDAKMQALDASQYLDIFQGADAVQCDEISGNAVQNARPVQYAQLDFRQFLLQHEYYFAPEDNAQGGSLALTLRSGRPAERIKTKYSGSVAYFSDLEASVGDLPGVKTSRTAAIDDGERARRDSANALAKSQLLSHLSLVGKMMDLYSKQLAYYVTGRVAAEQTSQETLKPTESVQAQGAASATKSDAAPAASSGQPETSLVSQLFEDFEKRKQARIDERKREKQQKEAAKKSPTLSSFFSANGGAQSRHSSGAARISVSGAFDQEMSFSTYLNEYAKFLYTVELSKPPVASRGSPGFYMANSALSSAFDRSGAFSNAEAPTYGSTSFAKNVERMKQRLLASDRRPASVLSE